MEIAQSCDQRDRMSLGMGVSSVILRHRADTEQSTAQHLRQSFHLVKPPEIDLKFRNPSKREPGWGETPLQVRPAYAKLNPLPSHL